MLYKNYTDLVNKLVWIIPKKSKRDNMRNILNDIVNTAYKIEYLINNNNSINDKDYIIINQCDGFAGQLGKYIFGEFVKDNYYIRSVIKIDYARLGAQVISGLGLWGSFKWYHIGQN